MSTPMFIREPVAASAFVDGDTTLVQLIAAVTEATLIEEITVFGTVPSTDAGRLVLYFDTSPVLAFDVSAGTADSGAAVSDRFDVNLTIPVGRALKVSHDVLKTAVPRTLTITAHGGIVR